MHNWQYPLAELEVQSAHNEDFVSIEQGVISNQSVLVFKSQIIKIGRSDLNTVTISHPAISTLHCIIWAVQFDEISAPLVYIKDLSLNGTFINGARMVRNETYLLQHLDILTIEYGLTMKYQSEYGQTEVLTGECMIKDNNITTDFPNWSVKNRILGSGTFGHVLVAQRKNDSRLCAVKVLKVSRNILPLEAQILRKLSHPNVVKIFDTQTVGQQVYIFEDLMCGGDLFSYLTNGECLKKLPEFESLTISFQILSALHYLHSQNIAHRDLKLDNILLESPQPFTRIILADFGIAKAMNSTNRRMFTTVGTPEYSAPEVGFELTNIPIHLKDGSWRISDRNTRTGYGFKCDIWSFGIVTHIMLSGISPFYEDGNKVSIIKSAKNGKLNFNVPQWIGVSKAAKNFIQSVLRVEMDDRLSVQDCLNHIWISKHLNDLNQIYRKILIQSNLSKRD